MSDRTIDPRCWFLTGATAVGKSQVGQSLAKQLGAEIVSLDSMAVYRGMDIGTAKPDLADRAEIRHHLIDILEPTESFSAAQYFAAAEQAVAEIHRRGNVALFVGGTPLYLKALLRGLFAGPPANWDLRQQISEEVASVGQKALHERLEQVDPLAASQIHPNDTRRLVRALEVYTATREPISHQQIQFAEGRSADELRVFVLRRPREELHARINARVDQMFAAGFVEEVTGLSSTGNGMGRTSSQAVGYREVLDHLQGKYDLDTTIVRIQTRTRRFAKRQETWFRSLSECRFVDIAGDVEPTEVATRIRSLGQVVA